MTQSPSVKPMQIRIRERVMRGGRVKDGLDYAWTEWQVINGRVIISRHGTQKYAQIAAEKFVSRLNDLGGAAVLVQA